MLDANCKDLPKFFPENTPDPFGTMSVSLWKFVHQSLSYRNSEDYKPFTYPKANMLHQMFFTPQTFHTTAVKQLGFSPKPSRLQETLDQKFCVIAVPCDSSCQRDHIIFFREATWIPQHMSISFHKPCTARLSYIDRHSVFKHIRQNFDNLCRNYMDPTSAFKLYVGLLPALTSDSKL